MYIQICSLSKAKLKKWPNITVSEKIPLKSDNSNPLTKQPSFQLGPPGCDVLCPSGPSSHHRWLFPPPYSSTLLHLWVVDLSSRLIVNISQPLSPLPVLWHAVMVSVCFKVRSLACRLLLQYRYLSINLSLWVTHQLTCYIVDWCLENLPIWPALLLFLMEETEWQFKMYQQCHFLGIITAFSLYVDSMLEMWWNLTGVNPHWVIRKEMG